MHRVTAWEASESWLSESLGASFVYSRTSNYRNTCPFDSRCLRNWCSILGWGLYFWCESCQTRFWGFNEGCEQVIIFADNCVFFSATYPDSSRAHFVLYIIKWQYPFLALHLDLMISCHIDFCHISFHIHRWTVEQAFAELKCHFGLSLVSLMPCTNEYRAPVVILA